MTPLKEQKAAIARAITSLSAERIAYRATCMNEPGSRNQLDRMQADITALNDAHRTLDAVNGLRTATHVMTALFTP